MVLTRKRVLGFGLFVLLGITIVGVLSLQRRLIFPSYLTNPDPQAGEGVAGLERIWLDTEEGKVESWFLPGDLVSAEHPGPVVLFAHGNAELIELWAEPLAEYRKNGINVFLPEYRSYGRSAGTPSEAKLVSDLSAFYDKIVSRPDVDKNRVVFHGRSIGGGVVCALARVRKPAALILQSTFMSLKHMGRRFLVPGFLLLDSFDNLSVVSEFDRPLLVLHGRQDELIPFAHSEALHKKAPQSTFVAYDCDHNSCPPDWKIYWEDVFSFLKKANILS